MQILMLSWNVVICFFLLMVYFVFILVGSDRLKKFWAGVLLKVGGFGTGCSFGQWCRDWWVVLDASLRCDLSVWKLTLLQICGWFVESHGVILILVVEVSACRLSWVQFLCLILRCVLAWAWCKSISIILILEIEIHTSCFDRPARLISRPICRNHASLVFSLSYGFLSIR